MRRLSHLFLLLLCLPRPLVAAPVELVLEEGKLPAEWQERFAALATDDPLEAQFTEIRENSFRRGNRVFEGTMRVDPQRGVSLTYAAPVDVSLVVTRGVFWRRPGNGEWQAYPAPEEAGLGDWTEALWSFDVTALASLFRLSAEELGEDRWLLELTPRELGKLPQVTLEAADGKLARIVIEASASRTTTYRMDSVNESPETEAEAWQAAFPATP
jgi:hypothetical protein